jgi:hypothetical protein
MPINLYYIGLQSIIYAITILYYLILIFEFSRIFGLQNQHILKTVPSIPQSDFSYITMFTLRFHKVKDGNGCYFYTRCSCSFSACV